MNCLSEANEAANHAAEPKQATGTKIPRYRFRQAHEVSNAMRAHTPNGCDALPVKALAAFGRDFAESMTIGGETSEQMEQARDQGFRNGQAQSKVQFDQDLDSLRQMLASCIERFEKDRAAYFQQIETEVVRLALAIARRILHRESQIDPLILQGAVRVVLDRVSSEWKSRLRVHPSQMAAWQSYFESQPGKPQPELLADASLEAGQCLLETAMGTTDLSLETQLEEIESGFFDQLPKNSRNP